MIEMKLKQGYDRNGDRVIKTDAEMYVAIVGADFAGGESNTKAISYDDDTDPPLTQEVCAYLLATLAKHYVGKYKLSPEQLIDQTSNILLAKDKIKNVIGGK